MYGNRRHLRILRQDGSTVRMRLHSKNLTNISGPLYSTHIGLRSLKKLGYTISFLRPKGPRGRITYHITKLNALTRQLASGLRSNNMKKGVLSQLTRKHRVLTLFTQLDNISGYNLPLHKHKYSLLAIYYLDSENNILDCLLVPKDYTHLDRGPRTLSTISTTQKPTILR